MRQKIYYVDVTFRAEEDGIITRRIVIKALTPELARTKAIFEIGRRLHPRESFGYVYESSMIVKEEKAQIINAVSR